MQKEVKIKIKQLKLKPNKITQMEINNLKKFQSKQKKTYQNLINLKQMKQNVINKINFFLVRYSFLAI